MPTTDLAELRKKKRKKKVTPKKKKKPTISDTPLLSIGAKFAEMVSGKKIKRR